jgi:tight adherence protein B
VSAVAGCLIGLMVWFGGRASREARRTQIRGRLRGPGDGWLRAAASNGSLAIRPWLLWVMAGGAAGWLLAHRPGALIGIALVPFVRRIAQRRRIARAAAVRDEQLADAVGSVAAALRAGLSVPQSLAYAADETPAPLGEGLRDVVDDLDLGVPLEAAVDTWATKAATRDARLFAGVLRVNRRSGGDLPSVLDQVVAALRERRAAAREVRALTAQARLSGAILGFLPIGFFAFLWLTSRRDIEGAFRSPAGLAAMAIGLSMEGLAFLWIRSLLAVR